MKERFEKMIRRIFKFDVYIAGIGMVIWNIGGALSTAKLWDALSPKHFLLALIIFLVGVLGIMLRIIWFYKQASQ